MFGKLVTQALEDARARGVTIAQVARLTGVSKTTIYRWRNGEWSEDPRAGEVRAFFTGLGLPVDRAFRVLQWSPGGPVAPEPELPDDLRRLARRLRDPNVPEGEKLVIWATIRGLLGRSDSSANEA